MRSLLAICATAVGLTATMTGCHPSPRGPAAPTTGSIGGLVVDHVTGEAVRATLTAHDQQSFVVASAHTAGDGAYRIDGLAPGTYDMVVELPGTSVQLVGIPVTAGHVTAFDIPVDSADVELPPQPYERVASDQILRFTPPDADPRRGVLEGTINDIVTRERVGAAVVTATSPVLTEALTGVSDDAGRFRFDDLPPGTYMLSAFYQVARRGQIEVRRTEIVVDGGTQVVVPLFVELSGTQ